MIKNYPRQKEKDAKVLKRPKVHIFVKHASILMTMLSALNDQIYDLRQRRGDLSQEG